MTTYFGNKEYLDYSQTKIYDQLHIKSGFYLSNTRKIAIEPLCTFNKIQTES